MTITWTDHAVNRSHDLCRSAELIAANERLAALRKRAGTGAVSRSTRTLSQECATVDPSIKHPRSTLTIEVIETTPDTPTVAKTVTVSPAILTALLRDQLAAAGRVWLLMRMLDKSGKGWLSVDEVRRELTARDAKLRVCGWRRLRQVLGQGGGVLWERDSFGRIWLHSPRRVALEMGLERLAGKFVELPVKTLLGAIADVRAAFYATFHAGREAAPISRQTVRKITGISQRTQQQYDARAQVQRTKNISVGSRCAEGTEKEHAFTHGTGSFVFTDHAGKLGAPGSRYHAAQLPNSYHAPFAQSNGKQQRRINRRLRIDLAVQGARGNGSQQIELERSYFSRARQAKTNRNSHVCCLSMATCNLWINEK